MAIWNLGSINLDLIYEVPHIPAPGETLAALGHQRFLGGKGTNMSVAAARAGAMVHHIGAVGADGDWAVERLVRYGVNTEHVVRVDQETGSAIVAVAADGENAIIINSAANVNIPQAALDAAMAKAARGDTMVFQNETNLQAEAAVAARAAGLYVAYAAAPFSAGAVAHVRPYLDFLILNAVEADQLRAATGLGPADLGVRDVIVTRGAQGADWYGQDGHRHFPSIKVTPVDTTGAGDTFTGYVLAGRDLGRPMAEAIATATRAAALMVTRKGTADVIPTMDETNAFSPC